MTGIFKANNPSNAFLLFLYGFLLKLPLFLHPEVPKPQQIDGFLYKALLKWIEPVGAGLPVIYPLITYLLLFTQAVTFNRHVSGQRLMQRPSFLVGMAYLLITSLFADWGKLSSPLIINTLLVWVWARMSNLYTQTNPKNTLFNIGGAIGICTFFYFPSVAFAILIVVGLAITRAFKPSEWIIALLGMITPYYFLLSYVFLTNTIKGFRLPGISITAPRFNSNRMEYVAIGILLFLLLIGFFYVQKNFRKQLIQARKSWNLLFLYLLVAIFIPFINATQSFEYWILCAVPISALAGAAFFYPEKKRIPFVWHWLIVGFIIMVSWFAR